MCSSFSTTGMLPPASAVLCGSIDGHALQLAVC
jgi:hypothetical protein